MVKPKELAERERVTRSTIWRWVARNLAEVRRDARGGRVRVRLVTSPSSVAENGGGAPTVSPPAATVEGVVVTTRTRWVRPRVDTSTLTEGPSWAYGSRRVPVTRTRVLLMRGAIR